MLGLAALGIYHTAISLVAVGSGLIALIRDREIHPGNITGKVYILATVLSCVTGFPIFQHGSIGKPHAFGMLTLLVLGVAALARRGKCGHASRYIEVIAYTATFFFHLILGLVETTTRLPVRAPFLSEREGPELQVATGVVLLSFVIAAALQARRLRRQDWPSQTAPLLECLSPPDQANINH
jgi:hypothetical protein